jgi:hypothetical protein
MRSARNRSHGVDEPMATVVARGTYGGPVVRSYGFAGSGPPTPADNSHRFHPRTPDVRFGGKKLLRRPAGQPFS